MNKSLFVVFSLFITFCVCVPSITLLGAFDHQADESSPLFWNGRLVIMETLPNYNPQHQSFCETDYFIVRDLATWDIISTIESSCNHAFGNALVTIDEKGTQTMWVYGTRWIRDDVGWDGPCNVGKCGSDVFWSTDLKTWKNASAVNYPAGMTVFNTDVTFVASSPASLPAHNWILVLEEAYPGVQYRNLFYIKNATTLDQGNWTLLDPSVYFIPNFNTGGNSIGACPSIRFIPDTGYYYVTTGGDNIYVVRSNDLKNWEQGHYNEGTIIKPTTDDCTFMSNGLTAWNPPNTTVQLMQQCQKWDIFVSDSDLTEIKAADGTIHTVFLYQPNNQGGTGFSNLFIHNGDLKSFFESYFD